MSSTVDRWLELIAIGLTGAASFVVILTIIVLIDKWRRELW